MEKKAKLDIEHWEDPEFADKIRYADRVGNEFKSFAFAGFGILFSFSSIAVAVSVMGSVSMWYLVCAAVTVLVVFGINVYMDKKFYEQERALSKDRFRSNTIENLFGQKESIMEMKIFRSASHLVGLYRDVMTKIANLQLSISNKRDIFGLVAQVVEVSGMGLITFFVYRSAAMGNITFGKSVLIIASVTQFKSSIMQVLDGFERMRKDSFRIEEYFQVLDAPSRIREPEVTKVIEGPLHIEFENVWFKYPNAKDYALENISFEILPNEKLGIVGMSGSGKSTLIKLLCKFYLPTQGRILINDVDIREITQEELHRHMGALFQNYCEYEFTAGQAIAMGNPNIAYDLKAVTHAAVQARAHDFIEPLENGYDQQLGSISYGGVDLSGGQNQRIALARVLYKNPDMFIFDEPTSSLDAISESEIFENIYEAAENRTAIMISHRFSTILRADRILIIENKTVGGIGTHQQLLCLNKTYADLYYEQAKAFA